MIAMPSPQHLATDWTLPQTNPIRELSSESPEREALASQYASALTNAEELGRRQVSPRAVLMEPFIREGNLGFIFGTRGHGKTWVAMFIASVLSTGRKIGDWQAPCSVPTLLVDGEVDIDETKERFRLLEANNSNLHILHHQDVFDKFEGRLSLNLADLEQQVWLSGICVKHGIKVLILDNLSCLMRGIAENDGDDWEPIAHWLLDLRRQGIAVIIVHHAGRNGQMRGHSRREDPAHWIIKVEKTNSPSPEITAFTTTFVKYRRDAAEARSLRWEIQRVSDYQIAFKCSEASPIEVFVHHVQEGAESASDIAELMGVSKGQISKYAKKAEAAGLIKVEGRRYKPVNGGTEDGMAAVK